MKRLLNILLCVMLSLTAYGQGLKPVGQLNPGKVLAHASNDQNLYIISADLSNVYHLLMWDGYSWLNYGSINGLPAHGINQDGEFAIKDAIFYNKNLYITGDYYINTSGNQANLVYKWDGNTWTDISNVTIKNSNTLNKFVVLDNVLMLSGIFEDLKCNLLRLDNGVWKGVGDWLTNRPGKDFIVDIAAYKGQIYASGQFSKRIGSDIFYTGVFDGKIWNSINHPPFLNGSTVFGMDNDKLILAGTPNNSSDYIKSFDGGGWDDISSGLGLYSLKTIWDIQQIGETMYFVGDFSVVSSGKKFNLLSNKNGSWKPVTWSHTTVPFKLLEYEKSLFIAGAFDFFGIRNIAKVGSADALLNGQVFLDNDGNCTFNTGDKALGNQVVILNPGGFAMFTNADGFYEIPVDKGTYEITLPNLIKYKTVCTSRINVVVNESGNYNTSGFALQLKPNVVDLKLSDGFVNGFKLITGEYNKGKFLIKNNGTTPILEAHFTINVNEIWSEIRFEPSYTFIKDGQYVWVLKNLAVDEVFTIGMQGLLNKGVSTSDLTLEYSSKMVNPKTEDYPMDNGEKLTFTEVDKLQPIWKQCGNGAFFNEENRLDYYIRFANVGKGKISKIVVRDTIDRNLYVTGNGFGTSHDNLCELKTETIKGEKNYQYVWSWIFDGINLPDSSTSTEYVGFVKFDIKLAKGFHPNGTVVCNDAEVMFDKQEPYVTNKVCSEANNLGFKYMSYQTGVRIFPNPATNVFNVVNQLNELLPIEVFNSSGQLVLEEAVHGMQEKAISTSGWSKGIYYVKINGQDCRKLIIQ